MEDNKRKEMYKMIHEFNTETYDRINVLAPIGTKERYRAEAERQGRSLTNFIQFCVDKDLKENGL